jgi:hypothetical protein
LKSSLLAAVRVVVRAESDPTRAVLFDSLASRSRAVRLAHWATQGALRGRLPAALAVAGYGFVTARVCLAAPQAPIWALPLFENDRRQIDRVAAWIGARRVGRSSSGLRLAALAGRVLGRALLGGWGLRYLRTVQRLCRRYGFLVSCRSATMLASAMVAADALRLSPVRAVLVSSDYNAEAVGLAHAARGSGLVTIYVAHAPTHHLSPALDFTLAILDGEAALSAYRRKGSIRARCLFKGVEGRERPLDPQALTRANPVIGIFLPKEVDWRVFREVVEHVQRAFTPKRVLVRWHPNALERPRLDRMLAGVTGIAACPAGAALDDDARRCDWVIADRNSSVPLSTLKAGVPAVLVQGLAVFPTEQTDLYGLVADGVVPPPCGSLIELEPRTLVRFYGAGWVERFRRHDAAYQCAADTQHVIRNAVLAAIGEPGDVQ